MNKSPNLVFSLRFAIIMFFLHRLYSIVIKVVRFDSELWRRKENKKTELFGGDSRCQVYQGY